MNAHPEMPEPPFCIDSAERANWLVRKVVQARAYGDKVRAWAIREQRRAEREEQQLTHLYGRQLEAWARQELGALNGRRRSIKLPGGKVGFRRIRAKLVIVDPAAVLKWAKASFPDAIITTERISRTAIVARAKETGEIPDQGVRIEPEQDRFFLE